MNRFEITIVFEDGETQKRRYRDYEKALKACAEYDSLKANPTYSIKAVHIREI